MSRLRVQPSDKPLYGSVPVPSDKSIGHRALIFAALSRGRSEIRGFSYGEDNVATLDAFRAMGVDAQDNRQGALAVSGVGLEGLSEPPGAIDCGNSGTTMRLMAGLLAAQPFRTKLVGDASLSRRPMMRIAKPLRARGGVIEGVPHPERKDEIVPPLEIGPRPQGRLLGLEYRMPTASAQVKSALLLSGLFAAGPTVIYEPLASRDHTERMMIALGLPVETAATMVSLEPPSAPDAIAELDIDLPGDLSAAAFLLCAAQLVADSAVTVRSTGLNPTRAGILDIIRSFGGHAGIEPKSDVLGEPVGTVTARFGGLRAAPIGGELALRAIDEIPIACALAARARGVTTFSDVGELRVKESDRLAQMAATLRAFGVDAKEHETGLTIEGRPEGRLSAARVASAGDHRIAMVAAVLGLVADGETVIDDVDCIATSFPRFAGTLRALGARVEVEP